MNLARASSFVGCRYDSHFCRPHLTSLLDAKVKVTIEMEAELPSEAPENVVRTVTENCRTLKFDSQGFEAT